MQNNSATLTELHSQEKEYKNILNFVLTTAERNFYTKILKSIKIDIKNHGK